MSADMRQETDRGGINPPLRLLTLTLSAVIFLHKYLETLIFKKEIYKERNRMKKEIDAIDLSNTLPKGVDFKIDNLKYTLIFDYKSLVKLSDYYGSVDNAITEFANNPDKYNTVVNFLYAGLVSRYQLTKQDIEDWIGLQSINIFYDLIFSAIMASFGSGDDESGGASEGEA